MNCSQGESVDLLLANSPYRAVGRLGQGAIAEVFLVEHLVLKKRFALKLIHRQFSTEPTLMQRLEREARTLGRVKSPHVLRIIDLGTATDGTPYLVLEFLRGHTLARELARRRVIPLETAVDWASQILAGLEAVHELSVTHRDLTPSNLFLREVTGYPPCMTILDFGLAGIVQRTEDMQHYGTSGSFTSTGAIVGSVAYRSPEADRGERVDGRADLFAVGLILFQMLTGAEPWEIDIDRIPSLTTFQTDLPFNLDPILAQACSRDPQDRYQTAGDFRAALRPFMEEPR